ncbi:hypothetical protein AAC387_Pa09g2407 [Persea americana]
MEASSAQETGFDVDEAEESLLHGSPGTSPVELASPHEALFLSLPYLLFMDLFTVRMVCKSLRDAVDCDALLWRNVVLERPLSFKVTDSILLDLVSKANGRLESLVLIHGWFFTDSALHLIAQTNPHITKLHIPGCSALTPGGVVRAVEKLNNLKHLRVYGIPNMKKEHLYSLNSLLRVNPRRPLVFYNGEHPTCSVTGDHPYIDVDICPKCNEVRIVFDCPREGRCQKWSCRGCLFCIVRCKECGGCISLEEVETGETVCPDCVCSECWLHLPKCVLCNRPSCSQHLYLQSRSFPGSPDFTCELCIFQPGKSPATI